MAVRVWLFAATCVLVWPAVAAARIGFTADHEANVFTQKMEAALSRAKVFLDHEKSQGLVVAGGGVPHRYDDKYLLAEQVTTSAMQALVESLTAMGVTETMWQTMRDWSNSSAVVLRLTVEQRCSFLREEKHQEESPVQEEVEYSISGIVSGTVKKTKKITITDYVHDVRVHHRLDVVRGAGINASTDVLTVWARSNAIGYYSRMRAAPFPDTGLSKDEMDVSWLVRSMCDGLLCAGGDLQGALRFEIDRDADTCWTPVRNKNVDVVAQAMDRVTAWTATVQSFVNNWCWMQSQSASERHRLNRGALQAVHRDIFVPVVAFFQQVQGQTDGSHSTPREEVLGAMRAEERRGLMEALEAAAKTFAPTDADTLVSRKEVDMIVIAGHMGAIASAYSSALGHIEAIIRSQLVAALGKEVTSADLADYMSYHYRRLYRPAYQPRPLTLAVRRSDSHSPEGGLSVEALDVGARGGEGGGFRSIETFQRSFAAGAVANASSPLSEASEGVDESGGDSALMSFAINAATRISFGGERHLHGWLVHTIEGAATLPALRLMTSARQFSSFIVLLGRVSSATTFEPKHAFIVQNKEELTVPLQLELLSNAKQFRDAIESLSPKQQRFARALRAMQLESTLFGVVVLQIKPQLERALHLLPDSLTKEIALTQELMELFIDYQIPTDLLSADLTDLEAGALPVSGKDRLNAVKQNVRQIKALLQDLKDEEIKQKDAERSFAGHSNPGPGHSLRDGSVLFTSVPSAVGVSGTAARRMTPSSAPAGQPYRQPTSQPSSAPSVSIKAGSSAGVTMENGDSASFAVPEWAAAAEVEVEVEVAVDQKSDLTGDSPPGLGSAPHTEDFTRLPQRLDDAFERMDSSHSTRPAIIRVGEVWTRERKKELLGKRQVQMLAGDDLLKERIAAFELLDALTRSGSLAVEHAALHVVVAVTHSFTDSVMETVVQKNRNPVEDVERSSVILAATLQEKAGRDLLNADQLPRLLLSGVGGRHHEESDVKDLLFGPKPRLPA